MKTLKYYLLILLFILSVSFSLQCYAQDFDLLKDYVSGNSILYQFNRSAYPTSFFPDTVSTISIFNGTYRTYIDSVVANTTDSVRSYHLTIHKIGIESLINSVRTISSRNIDTLYNDSVNEFLNISYGSSSNQISGWLFPDTVYQSPRCPYDSTIFYPYSYYFRYYYFPSPDTFDIRGDSLVITNVTTDCLDAGYTQKFIVTKDEGTIKRLFSLYNYFDWSYTDVFTKDEVSSINYSNPQPSQYSLEQNYPNPFNPKTTIRYQLPVQNFVTLKVFDVLGKETAILVNEEKPAGTYEVEFNPESSIRHPVSGIYFYQLKAGDFIETKKMILLK